MIRIFDLAGICYETYKLVGWAFSRCTVFCHKEVERVPRVRERYLATNRLTVDLGTGRDQRESLGYVCSNTNLHFVDLTHNSRSIMMRMGYQTLSTELAHVIPDHQFFVSTQVFGEG